MADALDMTRLRTLPPLLTSRVGSTVSLPPKAKDPIYNSPEFRQWRAAVIARAGGQCQALVNGHRCSRTTPEHRMYADHVIELRDGGSLTDPNNGMCLCRSCHQLKTLDVRKKRYQLDVVKWGGVQPFLKPFPH